MRELSFEIGTITSLIAFAICLRSETALVDTPPMFFFVLCWGEIGLLLLTTIVASRLYSVGSLSTKTDDEFR